VKLPCDYNRLGSLTIGSNGMPTPQK